MIINVRGGCGAGKSSLVKTVIDELGVVRSVHRDGRMKPRGYVLRGNVFVPGHYEIQNGGLDTIGDLDEAYGLIREFSSAQYHVLYEGMNQRNDVPRVCELAKSLDTHVVVLNTNYENCLASFRAKGQRRDKAYVESTHRKAIRDASRLELFGVNVKRLDRVEALEEVRRLLNA